MNPCMIIYGTTKSGTRFRPGTPVPDTHWAFRFLDSMTTWESSFPGKLPTKGTTPDGLHVALKDGQYVILVDENFPHQNSSGFSQLMYLVTAHDLNYDVPCYQRCKACPSQHPECVGFIDMNEIELVNT